MSAPDETTHLYRLFVVYLGRGDDLQGAQVRVAAVLSTEMPFTEAEAKLKRMIPQHATRGTIVGYGIEPVDPDDEDGADRAFRSEEDP